MTATVTEKRLTQLITCYYDLHVPKQYDSRQSWPLLLALHGYEGNKESMMRLARSINEEAWLIAALQGPYQFFLPLKEGETQPRTGFGWLTSYKAADSVALHQRNLLAVIDQTAQEYTIDRNKIFLLGFSQAVALNYRFVFSQPNLIRAVVGVCGGIPGDFQTKPYHQTETDVLHIAGTTDEFYPLERSQRFPTALAQRARSVDFLTYEVGHIFPRDSLGAINDWLLARATLVNG